MVAVINPLLNVRIVLSINLSNKRIDLEINLSVNTLLTYPSNEYYSYGIFSLDTDSPIDTERKDKIALA